MAGEWQGIARGVAWGCQGGGTFLRFCEMPIYGHDPDVGRRTATENSPRGLARKGVGRPGFISC